MSANFGIFKINVINIKYCNHYYYYYYHYYYFYLNQILTMSVALKSSLLTVSPGDSTQDQGSPEAGLGAWQVRKMQKRTRPIFSHLDQTRLDNWPKREFFLVQPRQPWKSRVGNGPILPSRVAI